MACTDYFPVLLCTTKLAQTTSQYEILRVRKRETVKEHVKRTLSPDTRDQRRNANEKEMNPAFWLWSPDLVRKRETVKEHVKRT